MATDETTSKAIDVSQSAQRPPTAAERRAAEHAGTTDTEVLARDIAQTREELSVTIDVPPELTVTAEGGSLVQLLSNLLRNAAQATPEAGAIGIRFHQGPAGQLLDIWDTGPGIPEHVAPVLFTSRRISTKQEGYGIGLTVVQRIAYTFRWDISFRRESERTLFRLTIPHPP